MDTFEKIWETLLFILASWCMLIQIVAVIAIPFIFLFGCSPPPNNNFHQVYALECRENGRWKVIKTSVNPIVHKGQTWKTYNGDIISTDGLACRVNWKE